MESLANQLPEPVGFVLGGGGSLGAMQVGMLQALSERGVYADLVVGTSIGAMNGAVLANNPRTAYTDLRWIWNDLHPKQLFGSVPRRIANLARNRTHLLDNRGLERTATRVMGTRMIEDLAVPFGAVAVDVETSEARTISSGPVVSAVMASAAIPAVFPPIERDGRRYVDGGIVANVPVLQAVAMGAKSLVVLDCIFADRPLRPPDSILSAMLYSTVVAVRQQALRDLETAATEVPVLYLPGASPMLLSPLRFNRTNDLISESHRRSTELLARTSVNGPGLYRSSAGQLCSGTREAPA